MVKADQIVSAVKTLDAASTPEAKCKAAWQIANSYLSPKSSDLPLLEGCTTDQECAETYAKHYVNKIKTLSDGFPDTNAEEIGGRSSTADPGDTFKFCSIGVATTKKLLRNQLHQVVLFRWDPSIFLEVPGQVPRRAHLPPDQRLL